MPHNTPSKIATKAGLSTFQQACDYLKTPRSTLEDLAKRHPLHFECLMVGVSIKIGK